MRRLCLRDDYEGSSSIPPYAIANFIASQSLFPEGNTKGIMIAICVRCLSHTLIC